jgi:hypothetical protein
MNTRRTIEAQTRRRPASATGASPTRWNGLAIGLAIGMTGAVAVGLAGAGPSAAGTTTSTTSTTMAEPAGGCPQTPEGGCRLAESAQLQIKIGAAPTARQLKWKWKKGESYDHGDLGDPSSGTDYALCVYQSTADVPALVCDILVGPSSVWTDRDPKGWQYKDQLGTQNGVQQIKLKPGPSAKTAVQLKAGGGALPAPGLPLSVDTTVTVQLRKQSGSGPSSCWTSEFVASHVKTNTAAAFKASAK